MSRWGKYFPPAMLGAALLLLQLTLVNHPWPVHPDETEFVSALGFQHPYPVHHPGYPLWVAIGSVGRAAGLSDYRAYEVWSIAACCGLPVGLALAVRARAGEAIALLSGLALGVNPLWTFHGATALNYSVAAAAGGGIAWLSWRAYSLRDDGWAAWAAAVLGAGLFLRVDLLMWFGPLVIWAAARCGRRAVIRSVSIIGACLVGELLVAAYLYRGEAGPSLSHTLGVIGSTSVFERGLWNGVIRNGAKLGVYLVWGLGAGIVPGFVVLLRFFRRADGERRFAALWLGPLVLFQLLIHVTEAGHTLWYLPAIYAGLAIGVGRWRRRGVACATLAAVCAVSLVQFRGYPWSAEATGWRRVLNAKVAFISARGLEHIDRRERIQRPNDFWTVPEAAR